MLFVWLCLRNHHQCLFVGVHPFHHYIRAIQARVIGGFVLIFGCFQRQYFLAGAVALSARTCCCMVKSFRINFQPCGTRNNLSHYAGKGTGCPRHRGVWCRRHHRHLSEHGSYRDQDLFARMEGGRERERQKSVWVGFIWKTIPGHAIGKHGAK